MQESKNISILIVEDSLTQAIQLQFLLENNGYTVLVAEDGAIGLKLAQESQPTLIISDIVMPNMDGYEMCSAVKDTVSLTDTPVILLTSLSNPEDVIKALTCRADNFVTKPYDDVFLLSRIEHILVNQELRRCGKPDMGIEIFFAGKTHLITSDRMQVVDLLFSTYENAVERNKELMRMQLELKQSNEKLQDEIHERERIAEELRKAKETAVDASRAKSEFLSNMSHELRSPLNSMLLLSQMLGENSSGNLSEEEVEFAKIVNSSGNDLLTLINDLLDLSKVEAAKMDLRPYTFAVQPFIEEIEKKFSMLAKQKGLSFKVSIADDTPSEITSDSQRLSQIIRNLLSNAFKFTEEGEIGVHVQRPAADTIFETSNLKYDESIAITVSDTGIGIPESKIETIFQSFTQADGSTSRKYGGTGLGLTISREFSGFLGGELQAKSEVGRGAFFTIYLPLHLSLPEGMQQETVVENETDSDIEIITQGKEQIREKESLQVENSFAKEQQQEVLEHNQNALFTDVKILLVDDDMRNVFSFISLLQKNGIKTVVGENGKKGLEKLAENPDVDLIVMDIMMPVMDGFEAMAAIREQKKFQNIPIIAVTAKAMEGDREKCIEAGATEYMAKPVEMKSFMALIEKLLTE